MLAKNRIRRKCIRSIVQAQEIVRNMSKADTPLHSAACIEMRWWWLVVWGRDVMVTRGGSYTHEAAGHAAMVSTEIKGKEVGRG